MKWEILNKDKVAVEEIVKVLLFNRGLKTKKEVEEFFHPSDPFEMRPKDFGVDEKELAKAVRRIKKAISKNEGIIIYGDYDADGICGTAILWETLYKLSKNVLPYIPERVKEGYGLNKESILKLKKQDPNLGLIVTVDQGITAGEKIEYARGLGIDVVVCDHHQQEKKIPKCSAVVHTDKICAAAIGWLLARELEGSKLKTQNDLDLVAIATIADLEPLVGVNRSLVKFGLKALNETKRCGLKAIFEEAGLKLGEIGTYEVGFIIAPRINAMGRLEHALESLRLVCTSKVDQAKNLADKLGLTNRERQALTDQTTLQAKKMVAASVKEGRLGKLIFLADESYQEGVIGLTAGKLVEEFYRPTIMVAKGAVYSKASARSISGFNIIEAIRSQLDLLVDAGGHPMAAGFTIETTKLELFKSKMEQLAEKELDEQKLTKTLRIDCELPLEAVNLEFYQKIAEFEPFGIGNPEPVFASRKARVITARTVGGDNRHLKFRLTSDSLPSPLSFEAIAFNLGYLLPKLTFGKLMDVAYNLRLNRWNGEEKLELKIKDLECEKD